MIVFGWRLYGFAYLVPGRFHVATNFFHLFGIPLIPIQSWIVTSETSLGWQGKAIGWSGRSIFLAWLRTGLVLGYLVLSARMLIEVVGRASPVWWPIALAAALGSLLCVVGFRESYRLSVADTATARRLAVKLGCSEAEAAILEVPQDFRIVQGPGWRVVVACLPLIAWVLASFVLGRISFVGGTALQLEALRSPNWQVRAAAATELERLGPSDTASVPVLEAYLNDEDSEVRNAAARALAKIVPVTAERIRELQERLKSTDAAGLADRIRSAEALAVIGHGYAESIPSLLRMLKDQSSAQAARAALVRISPYCAHLEALRSEYDSVLTSTAREALERLGPEDAAAVPIFKAYLAEENLKVRAGAALALAKIGPAAREALPELQAQLKSTDAATYSIRSHSVEALVAIGEGYADSLPDLTRMLREGTATLATVRALGQLGPAAREAVPALTELLHRNEFPRLQEAARNALERIDPKGKDLN